MANKNKVMIIMKNEIHIDMLTKYVEKYGYDSTIMKVDNFENDINQVIEDVRSVSAADSYTLVVVHSDIDNYKVERLPEFFKKLRTVVNDRQVVFLHPSRIHTNDRELILKSAEEPFKGLQGHDLEFDPVSFLDPIFKPLLT